MRQNKIIIFLSYVILLCCNSCKKAAITTDPFIISSKGIVKWGEYELIKEDYVSTDGLITQDNTIVNESKPLFTVYFLNDSYAPGKTVQHRIEYGIDEVIQVCLDGSWYTLPDMLPKRSVPYVLSENAESFVMKERLGEPTEFIEYTIDLAPFGKLPVGEYRLVEKFDYTDFCIEQYRIGYFWIVNSWSEAPKTSEISGSASKEDLEFYTSSVYPARSALSDTDKYIYIYIRNYLGLLLLLSLAPQPSLNLGLLHKISFNFY